MKHYKQLTYDQRYIIYRMNKTNFTQAHIAEILGVHKSTICRELKRNKSKRGYRPKYAHNETLYRRIGKSKSKISFSTWLQVEKFIRLDWSPEQISARLKNDDNIDISHEWIYQYILHDKKNSGDLYKHLRCQKKRKKRYGAKERRGCLKNRTFIDDRPNIVDQKIRVGDWEADTIIGKKHKHAIVTLTERKTRLSLIQKVDRKQAVQVGTAIEKMLGKIQKFVHTITSDNGKEFANHDKIASYLNTDFYFAHPYSSHERGLNENTNGLIRQYFPKGSDFSDITPEQINMVINRLNNRPRKCLGFLTPYEVFYKLTNVALTT